MTIESLKSDKIDKKSKIRQNTDKKPLGFRMCGIVSVWVYVGVRVCVYVWMRVFLDKSGQQRKALTWAEMGYKCVLICCAILFSWQ